MRQSFPVLRRAAVVLVGVISLVGAVALMWLLGRRELLGHLSNAQLFGLVALWLFPSAAVAAWELDRRVSRRSALAAGAAETTPVKTHTASARSERARHRRRIVHARGERLSR